MFLRQTGATIEDRAYVPYNRFPIGTYLALKGTLLPFGHHLAAQIRAAQSVTLLFFAGAAVLAYLALRRLRHGPWVALSATLLAFSSFYSLHYADMVSPRDRQPLRALADRVRPGPLRARRALAAPAGQGGDRAVARLARHGPAAAFRRHRPDAGGSPRHAVGPAAARARSCAS